MFKLVRKKNVAHWVESGTRGLWGGGANWAKNDTRYIRCFTAILSLTGHVKTVNSRYLPKESFSLTVCLKKVYFKVANKT